MNITEFNSIVESKEEAYQKFEEWLNNNDFDELLYSIILEHNLEYREHCYDNGYEPFPNKRLKFILVYIIENYSSVIISTIKRYPNDKMWLFKGFYFQIINKSGFESPELSDGSYKLKIINRDDKKLILDI